jgi:hypothetical protein
MNEKPKALRLADQMLHYWDERGPDATEVAAELRRLHEEHIEDQNVINVWRGRTLRAEQQRDELLKALEDLVEIVEDAISQRSAKDLDSFTLQPARAVCDNLIIRIRARGEKK